MFPLRKIFKRSPKSKRPTGPWVTYERCFLLTLGGSISGLAIFGIKTFSGREDQGPDWLPVFLFCLVFAGLFLIALAVSGSRKDAESVAKNSTVHEVILIVWIVAAPLYFLLKAFEKKKK